MDGSRRLDRWITTASLLLLVAVSWVYLWIMAEEMKAMSGARYSLGYMWMMPMGQWDLTDFALGLIMWTIMMTAMMIPTAAPVILLYERIQRKAHSVRTPGLTFAFILGYLAVWSGFSVFATGLQYFLTEWRLYSDYMETNNKWLGGCIVILAGIYQITPWKNACLAQCQSPLSFLTRQWSNGGRGAFIMGLKHGWFCLGCCWMLMLVLFAVGVMNLLWIGFLSGLVLLEKLIATRWIPATIGLLLIGFGVLRLAALR